MQHQHVWLAWIRDWEQTTLHGVYANEADAWQALSLWCIENPRDFGNQPLGYAEMVRLGMLAVERWEVK